MRRPTARSGLSTTCRCRGPRARPKGRGRKNCPCLRNRLFTESSSLSLSLSLSLCVISPKEVMLRSRPTCSHARAQASVCACTCDEPPAFLSLLSAVLVACRTGIRLSLSPVHSPPSLLSADAGPTCVHEGQSRINLVTPQGWIQEVTRPQVPGSCFPVETREPPRASVRIVLPCGAISFLPFLFFLWDIIRRTLARQCKSGFQHGER